MVLQDTWLFGGTIRENIAYGNPDATEEQILEAARATYVDRFVHSLPDGYDTVVDDEGDNLRRREAAGHDRPRVPGRPGDPDPRRGDELGRHPHRGADPGGDGRPPPRRTSFVIAHRLSTIRGADVILVMDDGRIVEQGNHDELLARGRRTMPASTTPSSPAWRPDDRQDSKRSVQNRQEIVKVTRAEPIATACPGSPVSSWQQSSRRPQSP